MQFALDTEGVEFIGINNRNLHSFKLDMTITPRPPAAAAEHPNYSAELTFVTLSGAAGRSDVDEAEGCYEVRSRFGGFDEGPGRGRARERAKVPLVHSSYEACPRQGVWCDYEGDAILACRAGADVIGVINVPPNRKGVLTGNQASDIVDAVRAFGER